MIRIYWLLIIIGTTMSMALFVGCGQAPLQNSKQGMNESSPLPTGTSGLVTVHVDAASYYTSDTIKVTLTNRDNQSIYFADHLTNCSVIQLQHQVNGNWENIDNCGLGILSSWHTLDAGKHLVVELAPSPGNRWLTGLYRVTLRYRTAHKFGSLITIYSAGFQIL